MVNKNLAENLALLGQPVIDWQIREWQRDFDEAKERLETWNKAKEIFESKATKKK